MKKKKQQQQIKLIEERLVRKNLINKTNRYVFNF